MKRNLSALAAGLLVVFTIQPAPKAVSAPAAKTNPPPKLNLQESPISHEVKASTSFAPVVKKVAPSVVNIYSTMTVRERPMQNPFSDDPFFRRFFGDDSAPQRRSREHKTQSLGSGVIVSEDGYIL